MINIRKKPITLKAAEWNGTDSALAEILSLAGGREVRRRGGDLLISTLEGLMTASPGDYIIQGIKGEVYPCKPDILIASYDIV